MPPRIVAVAGVSGSGKTTAADFIAKTFGLRTYAFVDCVKHALRKQHPELTRRDLWGDGRDEVKDFLDGLTVRQALWRLSRTQRKTFPGFTVAAFSQRYNANPVLRGWAISDCRDASEVDWCLRHAITIKLLRGNNEVLRGERHPDDLYVAKKLVPHTIDNRTMSKPELFSALRTILDPYNLLR